VFWRKKKEEEEEPESSRERYPNFKRQREERQKVVWTIERRNKK